MEMCRDKARLRVLSIAAAGPVAFQDQGSKARLISGRGMIEIALKDLDSMIAEGLVRRDADAVRITAAGLAARAQWREGRDVETKGDDTVPARKAQPGYNDAESPLAQLARRKTRKGENFLAAAELRAGERLRSDYTRAMLMPRLGAAWGTPMGRRSGGGSGGAVDITDAAIAARQRVEAALDSVGPELAGVLVDICCFLKGMEAVEFERGWPVRSAKVVLKAALAALARHYEPHRPRAKAGIVHWGSPDFRPVVPGT